MTTEVGGCRVLLGSFALVMLLLGNVGADELPRMTLSSTDNVDHDALEINRLMTAVYRQVGYSLLIMPMPSKRGLVMANSGELDGELYRVKSIDTEFTNLIAVPTALGSMQIQGFALRPLPLDGWASLANYRLGAVLGSKFIEYRTTGMQINYASKPEQLFLMLKAGRIDVVVMDEVQADMALERLESNGEPLASIIRLGVVDKVEYHTFLHRKHAALLPEVDHVLREMDSQGVLKRAWKATLDGERQP